MSERHLLVVDDDVDLRSLAQIILEQSGYQVLVAADGRQALQIAQQDPDPIDLLLTDLVMPGMDGAELGRQLRALRPAMRGIGTAYYLVHSMTSATRAGSSRRTPTARR